MSRREGSRGSPNYGGRLGYGIFQWTLRRMGVLPAYWLLAFVVPYYVLFRPSARRSARPYLRHRFPDRGPVWLFFATIVYFYRFGQVLVDQGAMGILGPEKFEIEFPEEDMLREAAHGGRGLVLVTSHVGNWQTAMAHVGHLNVPVSFQFRREEHTEGRHFFDLAGRAGDFRLVSPEVFLGGMVELAAALRRGECVAVMGDRAFGARTAKTGFLGEPAPFPISAYHLAYVTEAEVVVFLTVRTGRLRYRLTCRRLGDTRNLTHGDRDATIRRLLEEYARVLERHVQKHPFMWFNFFDFWNVGEE